MCRDVVESDRGGTPKANRNSVSADRIKLPLGDYKTPVLSLHYADLMAVETNDEGRGSHMPSETCTHIAIATTLTLLVLETSLQARKACVLPLHHSVSWLSETHGGSIHTTAIATQR